MLNNTRAGAAVFYVRDLDRTIRFYRETLGVEIRKEPAHEGEYALGETGGFWLIFFEGSEPPGRSPVIVFTMDDDIHQAVEALARQGVEIVAPVSEAPGGLSADFRDPDGHVLSFYQASKAEA